MVSLTTSHCAPISVVANGDGRAGDCIVNTDNSWTGVGGSSSLAACGSGLHGADDGYCEVQGDQVRACFHDRCWAEDAAQCGPWGTVSEISAWMNVRCEIGEDLSVSTDAPGWTDFQTFGPSNINAVSASLSTANNLPFGGTLEDNGWVLNGINDWGACDGGATGPSTRCDCACDARGVGEYFGAWCGGTCTGTMELALPDSFDIAELTVGMHYDNPVCRGTISVGHQGDVNANGEMAFHSLFDNSHFAEKQAVVFQYAPGDILRIQEQQTCIVHMYSLRVRASSPADLGDAAADFMPVLNSNAAHISVFGSDMISLLPEKDMTIEMWTKWVAGGSDWAGPISASRDDGSNEYGWNIQTRCKDTSGNTVSCASSRRVEFSLSTEGSNAAEGANNGRMSYLGFPGNPDRWVPADASQSPYFADLTGTWVHLAYSYDGASIKGYVDGSLIQQDDTTGSGAILYPDAGYTSSQGGWFTIGSYHDANEYAVKF